MLHKLLCRRMSSVLFVSPVIKASGNYATVSRLRGHIENQGIKTLLACPNSFDDGSHLLSFIHTNNIGLVLAIHAYKSGRLLTDIKVPYILVLGGTDVNEDVHNEQKLRAMTQAVLHAGHVIGFSEKMIDKVHQYWPSYNKGNVSVIPQAVKVEPSDFDIKEYLKNNFLLKSPTNDKLLQNQLNPHNHSILKNDEMKIFIVVGGIRSVKNPLFLVKTFSEWRQKNRLNCFLLFMGPQMDQTYYEQFQKAIDGLPGIIHIPGLEVGDTHAAMRDSCALVNSSDSEGMPLAILEAMCLGTPVVARGIPGNTAIVTDNSTGLIYSTGEEFVGHIEKLIKDEGLVKKLTHNATNYITQNHSLVAEETAYITIVKNLLKNGYGR